MSVRGSGVRRDMSVRGASGRARRLLPGGASVLATILTIVSCGAGPLPARSTGSPRTTTRTAGGAVGSYAGLAGRAVTTLEHSYYTGAGTWNMCVPAICRQKNFDWGADSLTYSLYLHWQITRDPGVVPIMRALTATAYQYDPAGSGWSDVPEWDAIADVREYQVTHAPAALTKAERAFAEVDTVAAAGFATGACPRIDYQGPNGGTNHLKTLETDSNYVKAALLLYQVTKDASYLAKAEAKYAAVRAYFLSPGLPLYTVYVFDAGSRCRQLPSRYYASVNGNMIWAGAELAAATGRKLYLTQALATAQAVSKDLNDSAGVYANLQAENDVVEPLVEAMYLLATADQERFARAWLLRSASAAASDQTAGGTFGRFFDGPPPRAPVTAWQVNGGLSLMFAAGRLDPGGGPANAGYWKQAVFVPDDKRLPAGGGGQVRVAVTGRAIAIVGTMGEQCCEAGHASVSVDGKPLFDRSGIWQNKSSSGRKIPGTILFAWRWPTAGRHVIVVGPAPYNPKEGGTFFHMTGYYLVR